MKNIHVLPTDKPSRLHLGDNGNFVFGMVRTSIESRNNAFTNKHIYITSDEEPKVNNFYFDFEYQKVRKCETGYYNKGSKKIILTTDQDLIKDGVQSIDDEFLEWFVKNPSCEFVNIEKYHGINTSIAEVNYISGDGSLSWQGRSDLRDYKIIIPKEEPKQETAVQYLKRMRDTYGFITTNDFKRADEMFERQIEKSFMKNLPIEDGVITAVQKAEQYYNEQFKNK